MEGVILSNRWEVGGELGKGACAVVHHVSCLDESMAKKIDYDCVVKMISMGSDLKGKKQQKEQRVLSNTLNYEKDLYMGALREFPYRARMPMWFFGQDPQLDIRYLVMERLGMDLEQWSRTEIPSHGEIGILGAQMLRGLKVCE